MALLALLLVRAMQIHAGADQASFGAYPDEPSHYLSGLLVRDYMAHGFPRSPVHYAMNYYLHVPYFAIGHWPPLFYLVEGVWMTVFGQSHAAVLWLIASITALLAATIFVVARRFVSVPAAVCAGLLFCFIPQVEWSNNLVMTDTAIALLGLWATLALGRYLETGRIGFALGFGILAGLTILTKYTGLYLLLMPLASVVLCRRWNLLRRWSFWLSLGVIVVIWLPWLALTRRYVRTGLVPTQFGDFSRLPLYIHAFLRQNGPVLGILLAFACAWTLLQWKRLNGMEAVLLLQPIAILLMMLVAPVPSDGRYLVPALPALILLLCLAIRSVPQWAVDHRMVFAPHWGTVLLMAFTLFYGAWALPSWPRAQRNDLRPLVDFILQSKGLRNASILVPANADGGMIAEFAMRDPARAERILARPNKLLSKSDWNGLNYQFYYTTPSEAEQYFEQNPIDLVIVRKLPQGNVPPERLVADVMKQFPKRWNAVAEFPSESGGYDIFQFASPAPWNRPTQLFMQRMTSSLTN
jgi:Dolichyl-phosphate-mannose-protein mannosyltransferase